MESQIINQWFFPGSFTHLGLNQTKTGGGSPENVHMNRSDKQAAGWTTCCTSFCFFVAVTRAKLRISVLICLSVCLHTQPVCSNVLWFIFSRIDCAEVAVCYLIGCDHVAVSHTGWCVSCWVTSLDSNLISKGHRWWLQWIMVIKSRCHWWLC